MTGTLRFYSSFLNARHCESLVGICPVLVDFTSLFYRSSHFWPLSSYRPIAFRHSFESWFTMQIRSLCSTTVFAHFPLPIVRISIVTSWLPPPLEQLLSVLF
jgi:hypothetical protein